DRLVEVGVERAVVNLHHLPQMIRDHLATRAQPAITFSDETDLLLETGGGILKALPLLGDAPFFAINGDVLWLNGVAPALQRLADTWETHIHQMGPDSLDALLLLHPLSCANGYSGYGDFEASAIGRLNRRRPGYVAPFIYAGAQIVHPRLFTDCPEGPFSMNLLWNRALEADRIAGIIHDGAWYHVGTPAALERTEKILGLPGVHSRQ
ncbi:MAG: nucleotidyltransferase family protein, partial [Rhodospirillaceae bacterium]